MGRGIFKADACAALALAVFGLGGAAFAASGHGDSVKENAEPDIAAHYVPIEGLTATISRNYRVGGLLRVEAGLEIADEDLRMRALAMKPRLRDAYTTALADYAGGYYRPGSAPDTEMLHAILQRATDRTLGESGADFLLGVVVVQ